MESREADAAALSVVSPGPRPSGRRARDGTLSTSVPPLASLRSARWCKPRRARWTARSAGGRFCRAVGATTVGEHRGGVAARTLAARFAAMTVSEPFGAVATRTLAARFAATTVSGPFGAVATRTPATRVAATTVLEPFGGVATQTLATRGGATTVLEPFGAIATRTLATRFAATTVSELWGPPIGCAGSARSGRAGAPSDR